MYLTYEIPAGVYRTGTDYKSRGRYIDANLYRWYSNEERPVGGWVERSKSTVTGKARAILAWRDNSNRVWAGIGTNTNLYAMTNGGYLYDITPSGFITGKADATLGGGYGSGTYGAGIYGTGVASAVINPATVWTLDTWGQDLVGVCGSDSVIYTWSPNTSGTLATALTGAPSASAVVVTAERIMMALGAGGDPRVVRTSDQENNTSWTTTVTNYARSQRLQTAGALMCGKRVNGGTLLFTDIDVWLATFLGQPLVYGYEKKGTGCGIISQQAVAVTDSQAFWMSRNGFWNFNGFATPLPCDVHDYVFTDLNYTQASKIYAVHVSLFGEVWWFYPSAASTEIDRYVVYSYRENHWNIGQLSRLSGCDSGAFSYPLMVDSSGQVWDHESGVNHHGAQPYAISGPIEIGQGDNVAFIDRIIPDEKNSGDVQVIFKGKFYPNGPETTYGPYTMASPKDVRLTARQVSIELLAADNTDFRVGSFRFNVKPRGLR